MTHLATPRITYSLAEPRHDADLRALLRELDMPGWARMTMTREPSYFIGQHRFGQDRTVIGHAPDGQAAGMFASAVHPVHVDGQAVQAGYLGALRIRPAWRHRARLLREGFALVREHHPPNALPLWYTAIASDNLPARRVLEAGLPGLPRYRHLNELVSLALPARRARRLGLWQPVPAGDIHRVCAFHDAQANAHQFAPQLPPALAARPELNLHWLPDDSGNVAACVALWHRQGEQQIRALGYRQPLAALRPLVNAAAWLTRRVPLPAPGQPLDHAYAAFLAVAPAWQPRLPDLLRDALALCPAGALSLGLHAAHPALPALVRAFAPLTYRTRIYAVAFGDEAPQGNRPAQPEIAVM
ncbi:MAG: hypothetical protein Q4G71_04035 [Pseudomonadota bacterium]|nr:hypothetical protein [Pseudomonadota bacterium]